MLAKTIENLAQRLQRQSVTSASRWACQYRYIDGNKWNFDRHPWLKEIHDCNDELIACQKSAQMGVTETAMNRTFYKMDIQKQSILYLLPTTKPDAYDFSNTRFDPALEESEHLARMFTGTTNNIGVKMCGSQVLYIRGAGTNNALKSIPVAHIMFDEINEMDDDKVRLAFDRTSGQFGDVSFFMLSTPTIPDKGVSLYYKDSSQDHFMFPCPHCGRITELTIDCLVVTAEIPEDPRVNDSYIECKECHVKLDHRDKINFLKKASWERTFTNKNNRGFYINQLYSMALHPSKIAKYYLETKLDADFEQEFWNSKMGLPFVQEGSSISEADVLKCIKSFKKTSERDTSKIVTMGVDIGKRCHYVICEWTTNNTNPDEVIKSSHKKVLFEGTVDNLQNIDIILNNYDVDYCVVDALPETRSCIELANRQDGRLKICYYNTGVGSRDLVVEKDSHKITVNRTIWLDISFARIRKDTVAFPIDTSEEFKKHMTSMYRTITKDKTGNPKPRWEAQKSDHFCHALLYAEVALKTYCLETGDNQNLVDIF